MSDNKVEDYEVLIYCLQDAEKYGFWALVHGNAGENTLEENSLKEAKKELEQALESIDEKLEGKFSPDEEDSE